MTLRRYVPWLLLLALVLTACAAGTNPAVDTPDAGGDTAGFFLGFWHGLISPVTFVISLFTDSVSIYDVHNTGNWYDFGFMFAILGFVGGSSRTRR